ncbi:MAG: group 1 truncated hemoglobin [Rhodospirillaceae bacterium]|jgi:hemoglobin|nr:group 1 truncated hemoglobin [Rhodospirillaceae bacterium]MBT5192705.1 group 1 truncated hemoglobin [Rhodospirillaceae bacterium]MBT5895437.1 group 1 truncated hemoglobin [Rhodospirillaceae bacterium]MBT6431268.1 group 1 truncated hemoglobin [Rhodospirillaceae bacterium]
MTISTFERYGGFGSINKVVTAFYDKVLDSPVLSRYFETIDMRRQIDHQTKFIASLMGGPASYSNQELERAHSRFTITRGEFNEMMELLQETLEDFDLEDEHVNEVVQNFNNRASFIVKH